ncbi:MAG: TetR/AcrR family transcriptional regulator [bacterium]|nr:TetR/AcrR family transcriptional regulator [bacterium]
MTTKEKILDASRRLFNTDGLAKVSVRDICKELNISAGNFSYHFPNKDKIILGLYKDMLKEVQVAFETLPRAEISITLYLESHKKVFLIQSKYKFIFLNLFEILTNYPEVKAIYLRNAAFERQMARELFNLYVSKGIIKKGINELQFERILNVGQILNTAWVIDAEIVFKGNKKQQMAYYLSICCGLLEPYLMENSLDEYKMYFNNLV